MKRTDKILNFLGLRRKSAKLKEDVWKRVKINDDLNAIMVLSYESINLASFDMCEHAQLHPIIYREPTIRKFNGCLGLRPKDEFIALYGIKAYYKWQKQIIYWRRSHPSKVREYARKSYQKSRQKLKAEKEKQKEVNNNGYLKMDRE